MDPTVTVWLVSPAATAGEGHRTAAPLEPELVPAPELDPEPLEEEPEAPELEEPEPCPELAPVPPELELVPCVPPDPEAWPEPDSNVASEVDPESGTSSPEPEDALPQEHVAHATAEASRKRRGDRIRRIVYQDP